MQTSQQRLKPGDLVEVRPAAEILATLDLRGECQGIPFMSEMLQHIGKQLCVAQLALKVCGPKETCTYRREPCTWIAFGARARAMGVARPNAGCSGEKNGFGVDSRARRRKLMAPATINSRNWRLATRWLNLRPLAGHKSGAARQRGSNLQVHQYLGDRLASISARLVRATSPRCTLSG